MNNLKDYKVYEDTSIWNIIFFLVMLIIIAFFYTQSHTWENKYDKLEKQYIKLEKEYNNLCDKYEDYELGECPICGGEAELIPVGSSYYIECSECKLETTYFDSKNEVVEYWNNASKTEVRQK